MLGLDISSESGSGGGTSSIYSVEEAPKPPEYWRSKVQEFQVLLNRLGQAREGMIGLVDYGPAEIQPELTALLDELDGKIGLYKKTAAGLNLAIEAYNLAGGSLPKLNTTGLGAVPLVPIAITAAIGAAGALIYWGVNWLDRSNALAMQAQLYGYLSPAAREQVAMNQLKIKAAADATAESPLASVSNIAKWVSIAAVAYFAYQAFQKMR